MDNLHVGRIHLVGYIYIIYTSYIDNGSGIFYLGINCEPVANLVAC
jgi:hypothetical protein